MNFFTYIVSWDRVENNVLQIEDIFTTNNIPHKVINSGSYPRENWMNVGDIRFYRQLYAAVKDFDRSYEYMFWLCGDVSSDDWIKFINRAQQVTLMYDVWAYAPHLTNEPWSENSCKLKESDFGSGLNVSIQTDGIAVFLNRNVVDLLEQYFEYLSSKVDMSTLTSGWGMDMIWCSDIINSNKLILRDSKYVLNHPAGSSYDHSVASQELSLILDHFYDFSEKYEMHDKELRSIASKIYGRMQHLEDCMTVESFYKINPDVLKKKYPVNYHTIYIDDVRKNNRDALDKTVDGNKIFIKSLNAKKDGEIDLFKKENPEFKFAWDGFKLGEIGNFGSHYIAWKYLCSSNLNELVIFEDDIIVDESFNNRYQISMNSLPKDYDVFSIYVDSNQHPRYNTQHILNDNVSKAYQDWSTLGYVISKQGAKKLCKYVEDIGMDHPTDWFIFRKGEKGIFNVYTLPPNVKNPLAIDTQYESQVQ